MHAAPIYDTLGIVHLLFTWRAFQCMAKARRSSTADSTARCQAMSACDASTGAPGCSARVRSHSKAAAACAGVGGAEGVTAAAAPPRGDRPAP